MNGFVTGTRRVGMNGGRTLLGAMVGLALLAVTGCGSDGSAGTTGLHPALPASLSIKPTVAAAPSVDAIRSSRSAHRNLSPSSAIELAHKQFPEAAAVPTALPHRAGVKLRRYVGRHAAVVTVDGKRALVRSTDALTIPMGGKERPVDPTLEVQGAGLVPRATASRYRIQRDSGRGPQVRFPRAGFGIDAVQANTSRKATVSDGAAFYANAQRDTDLIVQPQIAGAELSWQLRSPAAPETLNVAFPGIDTLRVVASKQTNTRDFALVRAGRRVGVMRAPKAVDASGRDVRLTTTVRGASIVIGVAHRAREYRYPILVDPYVADDQRYWLTQSVTDFTGWTQRANNVGYIPIQTFPGQPGGYGYGLNVVMAGNRPYVAGQYGEWYYTAPYVPGPFESEGARIFQADFGYTAHTPTLKPGNISMSCLSEGINNRVTYPPEGRYRGSQLTDTYASYGAVPGYGYLNCAAMGSAGFASTYGYLVHCFATAATPRPCDLSDTDQAQGTPGNQAVFGMVSTGGNAISNGSAFMGSSLIFETETAKPHTSLTGLPAGWVDNVQATITSTDYGLGVASITASAPGWTNPPSFVGSCIRAGLNPSSGIANPNPAVPQTGNKGDRNNRCHNTESTPAFNTSALAEGSYNLSLTGADTIGNGSGTPDSAAVKIDHLPPIITPSGALSDARNGFIGPNQDYTLAVTATDGSLTPDTARRSGVTSLTATFDGQPMTGGTASAPCTRPEGSCSLALNATLTGDQIAALDDKVPHTVTIRAVDALGHAQTDNFGVRVDATEPSVTSLSGSLGELADLESRPLREDLYSLVAEGRDNVDDYAESVEGEGEPDHVAVPAGSGLQNIVIRLDGQSVTSTTVTCPTSDGCEKRESWDWNTSTIANGPHTITIIAADKVGNQSETEFDVDLERLPDEPARTIGPRRTINGASAGDRLGESVAAIGDTNGDGHADYLVGAPAVSSGLRLTAGAAYIVLGDGGTGTINVGQPSPSTKRLLGPASGSRCGTSVASAGDLNNDSLPDMLVGCVTRGLLGNNNGRVYVVYGSTSPQDIDLATAGSWGYAILGPADNVGLGLPLGTAQPAGFAERLQSTPAEVSEHDINGDGIDDLVLGDSAVPSAGLTASGAAYVIFGKAQSTTVDTTNLGARGYVIRGDRAQGLFGYSATVAGDIDGDALADILIGAPGALSTTGGRAHVVRGSTSGQDVSIATPPTGRVATLTSGQPTDRFGVNVAALGDTNLDDRDDIAIGTSSGAYVVRAVPSSDAQVSAQSGYAVSGPVVAPLLSAEVPGVTLAGAGDLDGDERTDLAIRFPGTTNQDGFTIISPETARTLNVATLPGQRGAALQAGSDHSGESLDANGYQVGATLTENAQAIAGMPQAQLLAGRAVVLAERDPAAPGAVPITDTSPSPAPAPAAPAAARSGTLLNSIYTVKDGLSDWTAIRPAANSFAMGNIQGGKSFHSQSRHGKANKYNYGRFGDYINFCAYISASKLNSPPQDPSPSNKAKCPPPIKFKRFAKIISCVGCDNGPAFDLRATPNPDGTIPTQIPYYRNIRPWLRGNARPFGPNAPNPDGYLPLDKKVHWRYSVPGKKGGRRWVLINTKGAQLPRSDWAFIEAKYLPPVRGPGGLCAGRTPYQPQLLNAEIFAGWPQVCTNEDSRGPERPPGVSP